MYPFSYFTIGSVSRSYLESFGADVHDRDAVTKTKVAREMHYTDMLPGTLQSHPTVCPLSYSTVTEVWSVGTCPCAGRTSFNKDEGCRKAHVTDMFSDTLAERERESRPAVYPVFYSHRSVSCCSILRGVPVLTKTKVAEKRMLLTNFLTR